MQIKWYQLIVDLMSFYLMYRHVFLIHYFFYHEINKIMIGQYIFDLYVHVQTLNITTKHEEQQTLKCHVSMQQELFHLY